MTVDEVKAPTVQSDQVPIRVGAVGVRGSHVNHFQEIRIGESIVEKPMILRHATARTIVEVGGRTTQLGATHFKLTLLSNFSRT